MTNEEMEHTMQFILQQQAKFSVGIDRINETLSRHNEAIVGLLQISRTFVEHQSAVEAQMSELRAEMRDLSRAQKELSRAQIATDERLSAFITFVEKYISSRNGGERPP